MASRRFSTSSRSFSICNRSSSTETSCCSAVAEVEILERFVLLRDSVKKKKKKKKWNLLLKNVRRKLRYKVSEKGISAIDIFQSGIPTCYVRKTSRPICVYIVWIWVFFFFFKLH